MADNSSELSDDVLVTYADNELPEDEMNRLTQLIEADAEAASKVDAFRRSGEQLRDFFSVDVPAVTPPDIAEKIRAMGGSDDPVDNVVVQEVGGSRPLRHPIFPELNQSVRPSACLLHLFAAVAVLRGPGRGAAAP
jgi:anti-sigma factor RsiW